MTFIASVKARNGVAIIADSLVTTSIPVITVDSFSKFLQDLDQSKQDINMEDILALFENQAHHTNDYEEKLFKFDKYTAVTTAGTSSFGKRRTSEIIDSYLRDEKRKQDPPKASLLSKVDNFSKHIKKIIRASSEPQKIDTDIVFTHYNAKTKQTEIIQALVRAERIDERWKVDVKPNVIPDVLKVCLNGQNGIAYNLLYSYAFQAPYLQQKFIENFIDKAKCRISAKRKQEVLDDLRKNIYKNFPELLDEVKVRKIRELSLQEAVNLAFLLLKAEMDFQKYTQEIPTIGGVIKVATIDANGYNVLCGDKIISPV